MRFVICPDYVISKNDGDMHWINAAQLARLYNVSLNDPRVVILDPRDKRSMHSFRKMDGDVYLRPRYDGDYFDANR